MVALFGNLWTVHTLKIGAVSKGYGCRHPFHGWERSRPPRPADLRDAVFTFRSYRCERDATTKERTQKEFRRRGFRLVHKSSLPLPDPLQGRRITASRSRQCKTPSRRLTHSTGRARGAERQRGFFSFSFSFSSSRRFGAYRCYSSGETLVATSEEDLACVTPYS